MASAARSQPWHRLTAYPSAMSASIHATCSGVARPLRSRFSSMYSPWQPLLATGRHTSGTPFFSPSAFILAPVLTLRFPSLGMW